MANIKTQRHCEPTPGMISALPSSLHSHTFALICSRTSDFISPVSPEKRARKPCVRLLITSISCRDTVWTTSFLFCSSPSGHCTNCVYKDRGCQWKCSIQLQTVLKMIKRGNSNAKKLPMSLEQDLDFDDLTTTYLSSHGIIVSGSGEGAAQLTNLSSSFVNGNNIAERQWRNTIEITCGCSSWCYETRWHKNKIRSFKKYMNIPCLYFLFAETVDHLVAQVVYRLHLSSLKSQLAHFRTLI